jgi:hypothetical protein
MLLWERREGKSGQGRQAAGQLYPPYLLKRARSAKR